MRSRLFPCIACCWMLAQAAMCRAGEPAIPKPDLAAARELSEFSLEGINRRLGPDYAFYHPNGPEQPFPDVYLAPARQGPRGRRYQLGGPWSRDAGDYSSTQGQVLYVPDRGPGIDRVTILEMSNNVYTESPEPPWWGGFRPEPCVADWERAIKGPIGFPIFIARGMGPWSNLGIAIFSSGWVATAGTCTARGDNPVLRFPPGQHPIAISVAPRNEFAFVAIHDSKQKKGQLAVLGLEGCGRGKFVHDWRDPHPCLLSTGRFTRIKLLGCIDLPGIQFPTGICAVGDTTRVRLNGPDGHQGVLSQFDLSQQATRDRFYSGDNAGYVDRSGYAVVIAKYEHKVAFIDLEPLFQRVREMYFTTDEKYRQTRNSGPDPRQWPYTFDVDPTWAPQVVKVMDHANPTAVLADMSGGPGSRAFVASIDGTIGIYEVGGLASVGPASPDQIRLAGQVQVGRNPVCLAYEKGSKDTFLAVSRGDREIAWVRYSGSSGSVIRRLRDARLIDPVFVESADTHGTETAIITVCDFKGRKILNYRYADVVFVTNGGARFGIGPDGKGQFECGGILELPGSPFCVSATNVN